MKRLLHTDSNSNRKSHNTDFNLCEQFSDYFVTKIAQLRLAISSKISPTHVTALPADPPHTGPTFSTIPMVTASEVANLLHNMPSKSSGMDYIPTSLLKTCHTVFPELIASIANLSFREGSFLHSFKTALITNHSAHQETKP